MWCSSFSFFKRMMFGLSHLDLDLFFFLQPVNATWASLTRQQCVKYGGRLVGGACDYVPDITLMSFILFFGTYACSMGLKKFKTSRFFPTTVSRDPVSTRSGLGLGLGLALRVNIALKMFCNCFL